MLEAFVFLGFALGFGCDITCVDLKFVLKVGKVQDPFDVLGEHVENL